MIVYTDGSSIRRSDGTRIGGIGIWFGRDDTRNMSMSVKHPNPTNQVSELMAIKHALVICHSYIDLVIKSDSQYAINCITKWNHTWKCNGWKNSRGVEVANVDIIKSILALLDSRNEKGRTTTFVHVYGHMGEEGNEAADKLAGSASTKQL